ncbi:MAG: hypothetical protein CMG49_05730 [Candidatus Marinimicrobia bacterium]|nr:hypothetical protein [Candidatus Neomarinimicrobiota bacterium]|tara:strand:+ start:526 stop:1428 length:903 start_codon:yes stop_codon:yes gene_type:complete
MKNLINFLFFVSLGFLILLSFWKNIVPWDVEYDEVCGSEYTVAFTDINCPLGTNEFDQDFALIMSEAITYNVSISIIGCLLFMFFGIIFGLVLGLINDLPGKRINIIKKPKYLLKFIVNVITEISNSLPFLIILIISVIYVNYFIEAQNNSMKMQLIITIIALFNTHKLSMPLSDKIKSLRKQEFILAAKASGLTMPQLIFKHILYYESKSLIIINMINFFLFSVMMEIFLTVYQLGSMPSQISLGNLIFESKSTLPSLVIGGITNTQLIYMTVFPFLLIFLLCLTIRWIGQRVLFVMEN